MEFFGQRFNSLVWKRMLVLDLLDGILYAAEVYCSDDLLEQYCAQWTYFCASFFYSSKQSCSCSFSSIKFLLLTVNLRQSKNISR